MIEQFTCKAIPALLFGLSTLLQLPEQILKFGKCPLIVTGASSFRGEPHYQLLIDELEERQLSYQQTVIGNEPSPELIDNIVLQYKDTGVDVVVAIGGGSCLDAGKAIAAMFMEQQPVVKFLEGVGTNPPTGRTLPFIAIPTTSGTGSEATANAVISSVGRSGFKKSLRHNNFVPNLALVDPSLTLSCPSSLTATCGMDAFTQLVEGYLSTNSAPLTDTLALEGIRAIKRSLLKAFQDGANVEARCDLSYASYLSGIVLASAGLGTVHGFASVIGGLLPVPHGVVCATLMAPANSLTIQHLQRAGTDKKALDKYTRLGKIFSSQHGKSDSWFQDYFIEALARLTEELSIPSLKNYQLENDDIKKIVSQTSNKYNPIQFDKKDLNQILQHCLN